MKAILDMTEASVRLISEQEDVLCPAVALNAPHKLEFGDKAKRVSKLNPLTVRFDYWSRLSTLPFSTNFGECRHAADIVYEQLRVMSASLAKDTELHLIAPANFSNEQLSLFMGISESLGFKVTKIIDRALAAASREGPITFVEFQWRQALVSTVGFDGEFLFVDQYYSIAGAGVLDIEESVMEVISKICVDQTRFDPRRSAESEQLLLLKIPSILRDLDKKGEIEVGLLDRTFRLNSESLSFLGEGLLAKIKTDLAQNLVMEDWIKVMPGLEPVSTISGHDIIAQASKLFTQQHWSSKDICRLSKIVATGKDFTTPHFRQETTGGRPEGVEEVSQDGPTHLLINNRAHPLLPNSSVISEFRLQLTNGKWHLKPEYKGFVMPFNTQQGSDYIAIGTKLYRHDGVEALVISIAE